MSKKVFAIVLAAILLASVHIAQAQQTGKLPRMGVFWPQGPEDIARQAMTTALLEGLRELGYVEAKNIAFEYRFGEGRLARFPELAADLVSNKVDIIVAGGIAATRAAKNATKTIPIVMIGVGADPVEAGLVESLAHPGGNVTGFTNLSTLFHKFDDVFAHAALASICSCAWIFERSTWRS
jgi:putative ABC transport system substrate-binding protein